MTAIPTARIPRSTAQDQTVVHLLRHGDTHNPAKILYGRLPGYNLSELGRTQAEIVAKDLADHDITHVMASPLERAQQTAAPVAEQHNLTIQTDNRLIESASQFEGLRIVGPGGVLRDRRHWRKFANPLTPSWGEPYLDIAHRMLAAIWHAKTAAYGHEVVCVSHQSPIWIVRRFIEGKRLWHDPRKRQCSLASLTSFIFNGDQFSRIVYTEPAGQSDPTVTGA